MPIQLRMVPHRESWKDDFASEAQRFRAAAGSALISLHHIGSTAIPGIHAKPIIDMLGEVRSLEALDDRSDAVRALGYEVCGEFGIRGRRYFRKDDAAGVRTHQIHAFVAGSPDLKRHLAFRDYLRAHPARARAYNDLKVGLVASCDGDVEAYMDGKDAFVKTTEREALAWFDQPRSGGSPTLRR